MARAPRRAIAHPVTRRLCALNRDVGPEAQTALLRTLSKPEVGVSGRTRRFVDETAILLGGYATRRSLMEGSFTDLHYPGEFFTAAASCSLTFKARSYFSIAADRELQDLLASHPSLALALQRDAELRTNPTKLDQDLNSFSRLASLLCETVVRLTCAIPRKGASVHLPVAQVQMAQAMKVEAWEIYRAAAQLERRGVVKFHRRAIEILKPAQLASLGHYVWPLWLID